MKPFSQACENNKLPIYNVIKHYFSQTHRVLEIGTGTGQHAVFFAKKMPHLFWQTSDRKENHEGINLWLQEAKLDNLGYPIELDVSKSWPKDTFDGAFSANTSHIMSWSMVNNMFIGVKNAIKVNSFFCLYGPFNFNNKYTSDSNKAFDQMLQQRDPESGLRNFEALEKLASENQLALTEKHQMPANNFILVWQKKA